MTLIKKIAYNTIISIGARIIGVALSLIGIGFIARYLGQEGFGSYSLIIAFLYTFNILADFGLYSLMTREISRPGVDEKKIASNIFTIRLISLLFFLGLSIFLVQFFPYNFEVKLGVIIVSFAFLFSSLAQVLMGVFQKNLKMEKPSIAELTGRTVQLILFIVFIYLDLGLFSILIAFVFGNFFIFLFNLIFVKKYISIKLSFNFSFWKKLLKSAFPIALSIVLTLIYFKIDSIFLSLPLINSNSTNPIIDVGIYSIAYKILEGIIFFPAMLVGLVMPLLSKTAFSNKQEFIKIFQKTLDVLIIFIVPLVIGLILLSSQIVLLVGGGNFAKSSGPLNYLAVAIGLIFLGTLFGHSIIALDRQKIGAWIYFGGMLLNVAANLVFIPKYSYLGAAATTLFTEFLVTILMLLLIYKTIKYFPCFKRFWKALLAGTVMGFFIFIFQSWNVFLLIFLGFIIYSIVLLSLKGISKQEILLLFKN